MLVLRVNNLVRTVAGGRACCSKDDDGFYELHICRFTFNYGTSVAALTGLSSLSLSDASVRA